MESVCVTVTHKYQWTVRHSAFAKGVAEAAKHTFDNTKKVLEQVWPEVL